MFDLNAFHGACLGTGSVNASFSNACRHGAVPADPALTNPDYRDVDPRLGIGLGSLGDERRKTVIRAGLGLDHGAAQNDD